MQILLFEGKTFSLPGQTTLTGICQSSRPPHTTDLYNVCVGVVKAPPVHNKNPAQHYSDIQMSQMEELLPVFHNQETNSPKEIDCIHVDTAHEIVQYYWNHGKLQLLSHQDVADPHT